MHGIVIDLILFGIVYSALLGLLLLYNRSKGRKNNDSDEDGGISLPSSPELDLPPGICLPDGPVNAKKEAEEVLA